MSRFLRKAGAWRRLPVHSVRPPSGRVPRCAGRCRATGRWMCESHATWVWKPTRHSVQISTVAHVDRKGCRRPCKKRAQFREDRLQDPFRRSRAHCHTRRTVRTGGGTFPEAPEDPSLPRGSPATLSQATAPGSPGVARARRYGTARRNREWAAARVGTPPPWWTAVWSGVAHTRPEWARIVRL